MIMANTLLKGTHRTPRLGVSFEKAAHMTFAINLALLLLGTIAALAAFGGETWKKGDESLSKRVTRRGWLALMCMLATLTLGIIKEIRNNAASATAAVKQRELENDLASTTVDLRTTRENLERASDAIKEYQRKIDIYQGKLDSYQEIVGEIRDYSLRQEQVVMIQAVTIAPHGTWKAPNKIYSGSKIEAYFFSGEQLQVRYEGMTQHLKRGNDDWAKLFVIGPSGRDFSWSIYNPSNHPFEGKIEVLSTPRSRSKEWSWLEEKLQDISQ